jgi:hypothetical protein
MSTVVPSGGSLDDNQAFRAVKVVDRSNAFSRFSKRAAVRVESSVFKDGPAKSEEPPTKLAMRARSPNYTDPFSDNREVARHGGLKMVERQAAAIRHCSKKVAGYQAPIPVTADEKAFTYHGTPYGGRATYTTRNTPSDAEAFDRSQQRSMERFRKTSARAEPSNVLRPETLADHIPKGKPQRFLNSCKYSQPTLQGVLNPAPLPSVAQYQVVPPWHTSI